MSAQYDHDDALDTDGTWTPVCPHCGFEMQAPDEFFECGPLDDKVDIAECDRCEKRYRAARSVSVTYSTEIVP